MTLPFTLVRTNPVIVQVRDAVEAVADVQAASFGADAAVGDQGATLSEAITADAATTTEIVAAVAGKQIWVYGFLVVASAASGTFVWKRAETAKTGAVP